MIYKLLGVHTFNKMLWQIALNNVHIMYVLWNNYPQNVPAEEKYVGRYYFLQ